MRLLIDQNVPDSVARFFRERGHEVTLVRDSLGRQSPDQLIAITAELQGVIVVSIDRDFKRFRKLLPEGSRAGFVAGAGFLSLNLRESRCVARLAEEIESIEFYAQRAELQGKIARMQLSETRLNLGMEGGRRRRE